jgi:hypothetical protein
MDSMSWSLLPLKDFHGVDIKLVTQKIVFSGCSVTEFLSFRDIYTAEELKGKTDIGNLIVC